MSGTAEQYVVASGGTDATPTIIAPSCVLISKEQLERYREIEACARMLAQVVQEPLRTLRWKAMSDARRLGLIE
jgi:hypothetical protein